MKRDEHAAATRSKVETAKGSGAAVHLQVAENSVREDSPNVFIALYVVCAVDSSPEVNRRNAWRAGRFIRIPGAGLRPKTFEAFQQFELRRFIGQSRQVQSPRAFRSLPQGRMNPSAFNITGPMNTSRCWIELPRCRIGRRGMGRGRSRSNEIEIAASESERRLIKVRW